MCNDAKYQNNKQTNNQGKLRNRKNMPIEMIEYIVSIITLLSDQMPEWK